MIYITFLSPFSLEVLFETLCTQRQQLLTHNTKITDLEYTSLTLFAHILQSYQLLFYSVRGTEKVEVKHTEKAALLVLIMLMLLDLYTIVVVLSFKACMQHRLGRANTYLALFYDPLDSIWHHLRMVFQTATQYNHNEQVTRHMPAFRQTELPEVV